MAVPAKVNAATLAAAIVFKSILVPHRIEIRAVAPDFVARRGIVCAAVLTQ
jgi:hypothetical protein